MHTTRLRRPYVLWWPPDVSTGWGTVLEVDRFEQVSSDGCQMSLARKRSLSGEVQWIPMSGGFLTNEVPCQRLVGLCGGCLYSEVQCMMVTWGSPSLWTDRHDWKHYLPQLRWRVVKICCFWSNQNRQIPKIPTRTKTRTRLQGTEGH